MSRFFTIIFVLLVSFMCSHILMGYAAVVIPGTSEIAKGSIGMTIWTDGSIESAKNFGLNILGILRIIISGIALVYLVLIGVYMIIGSDSEEKVKTQRQQIIYALIGFLFLNIPSLVYTIFTPGLANGSIASVDNWSNTAGSSVFWNTAGFEGLIGNMIAFLRLFVFGAAVLMFTWGLFELLISGGDDEKRKTAKNRILYGLLGLIFLWFVGLWWQLVAVGDFGYYIPNFTGTIFALVMYFAAPVAIFMLIWGAYLFITSAGDEERIKKWKSILINTGIATIILLAALSFMTDLITFQL